MASKDHGQLASAPGWPRFASASLILVLASCDRPPQTVASPPFAEVFELAEIIELGEDPADSIVEIGVFVQRNDGGFIIGDRFLPRVRTYAEDGSLEAGFGRFGDGSWEFRRIDGVAQMRSGRIVVVSWRNPGLTYLTSELARDTIVPLSGYVVFDVLSFGPDLVLEAVGEGCLAEGRADENGRPGAAMASAADRKVPLPQALVSFAAVLGPVATAEEKLQRCRT